MNSSKLYPLLLFWMLWFGYSVAQPVIFTPVSGSQQLNEEQIRNICQLPDGRILIVTEGMFNLYDGQGFQNIHIDDKNIEPLAAYTGFHHCYLEGDRLWLKNQRTLTVVNLSYEKCLDKPSSMLRKLGFNEVATDLFTDADGYLWIVNEKGQLFYRHPCSGVVKQFQSEALAKESKADPLLDLVSKGDSVFLFYKSGGLCCLRRTDGHLYYTRKLLDADASVLAATLYVVPVKNYLYQLRNGRSGQLSRFDISSGKQQVLHDFPYWINNLSADKNGNIWMSCSKGLWYYPSELTEGQLFPDIRLVDSKTVKTEVSYVFFDHQDGLWAGTLNKGVYYYHPDQFPFKQLGKSYLDLGDGDNLKVTCFGETTEGSLLIGCNKGVYRANSNIQENFKATSVLENVHCNAIIRSKKGICWMACNEGLYRVMADGKASLIIKGHAAWIYETPDSILYACINGRLLQYNNTTQSFTPAIMKIFPGGIRLFTSWGQNLLGVSDDGMFVFNPLDGSLIYPNKSRNGGPMFNHNNHRYTCLLQDSKGFLWMGTYDGLNMWDPVNQKLYQLHTADGLVNNSIKAIREAGDGSLWVTTARGVSHIFRQQTKKDYCFQMINYGQSDGVLPYAFAERSLFIDASNRLFAGGLDGFNMYEAAPVERDKPDVRLLLMDIKLAGRLVEPGSEYGGRVILEKPLANTDSLLLHYDQNFFSIRYAGLNYLHSSRIYYRYMLAGLDKDWRPGQPAASGEAFYTNVSPGSYQFKVQASTSPLYWPDEYKSLSLIIKPAFWNTPLAKTVYFLLVVIIGLVIASNWMRKTRRTQARQQQQAVESAKSDFIANLSHEIRTPLSLLISPLRLLRSKVSDPALLDELSKMDSQADMLLETVNQLLDYKRVDASIEQLRLRYCNDLFFLQHLCSAFEKTAAEKQIDYRFEIEELLQGIYIDQQKVSRMLTNLLANAFKFTNTGGHIRAGVYLDSATNQLHINVADTGIGIDVTDLNHVFDRFYQANNHTGLQVGSGLGLYMVREYAHMHNGTVTIDSQKGKGTQVSVMLTAGEPGKHSDIKQPGSGKQILLIEDHPDFRDYLEKELSDLYTITTAENGKAGLEKALASPPDLIITDMMMPEMSGEEFCRTLRANLPISHIPVIMLTARVSATAEWESYNCGADAYLEKPVDTSMLRLRSEKLLELLDSRRKIFDRQPEVEVDEITTNPLEQVMLEKAVALVENNLSDPSFSVEKFSAEMHMDRTGLYRKLQALTGHSPSGFIKSIRMKKAAQLLLTRQYSVGQVAELVGFSSVSYFSRSFNDTYSKSPSQYITDTVSGGSSFDQ